MFGPSGRDPPIYSTVRGRRPTGRFQNIARKQYIYLATALRARNNPTRNVGVTRPLDMRNFIYTRDYETFPELLGVHSEAPLQRALAYLYEATRLGE